MRRLIGLCLIASALLLSHSLRADDLGIRAPEGFEVSLYAGDELAHDIYSMTIDSQGRIVVAGAGYIKTLHDDDGDGRADRATLFSELPKSGAHGLLCDGDTLYASGDNGILKFTDRDGDGQADGEPERWIDGLSHKEHGCNGIERGPDGWIYVICGNDAGITAKFASTKNSPVTKPNCGAILRFSPDGEQSEILAHGFRNPYDLCFHANGNLFTVDADGERDHHLPWYAPNRLFDVAIGMHHGWVLNGWQWSWNRPASYFDNVERCAEIGRGSPTGMLSYQHTAFPSKFRGGIFSACWTLGRIYHYPLSPRGSTFDGQVDVFLETTGQVGFAPVDMAVGPDGAMFVAIGGRRTRGSVFKVAYVGPVSEKRREPESELEQLLATPQPLAAWSRARWLPLARKTKQADLQAAALNEEYPVAWRVRAIEVITDVHRALSNGAAEKLIHADEPDVAARAVWNLSRLGNLKDCAGVLGEASKSESPIVQRAAWEALQQNPPRMHDNLIDADWKPRTDRRVRAARALALSREWAGKDGAFWALAGGKDSSLDSLWLAHFRRPTQRIHPQHLANVKQLLAKEVVDASATQELLRLAGLAFGDISVDPSIPEQLAGYSLSIPPKQNAGDRGPAMSTARYAAEYAPLAAGLLRPGNDELNREAARLLAMLGRPEGASAIEPISALLTSDSSPVDDIHYLMCLSRMPGERSELARASIAAGIAGLDGKMKARSWYPSRNWPDRVGETFAALSKHDAELPAAVIAHEAFKSPSQAFLFTRLDVEHQIAAARKLLQSSRDSDEEEDRWTTELVTLVATLPAAEALPAYRGAWDQFAVRDAILLQLAKAPDKADLDRFLDSLASIDPTVVEKAAVALSQLEVQPADEHWLALAQALRQACSSPPAKAARQALVKLGETWSAESIEITEPAKGDLIAAYQAWFDWFTKKFPALSEKLNAATGDAASWKERLAKIDWASGDVANGKLSFEKRSCVKCHAGTSPLGPDLAGAADRLSHDDLLAAIADPSKDVSPLYQATQIVTSSGRIYHGLIVYESPDGTLLTTGPDTTIRIAGDEVVSMGKSRLSLMPTGLLANAADQELADLFAYLHTLRGKK